MNARQTRLLLASTSPYRRRLLARLQLPFSTRAPGIEESPRAGEGAEALALRLAVEKSTAVARSSAGATVIGSDQTAVLDDTLLRKPGGAAEAVAQLMACRGRTVVFHTAVALSVDGELVHSACIPTEVEFRDLSEDEIRRYVALDEPFDCAGSFRWEGVGISLFRSLRSADPTALEGLPLISVADMLRTQGFDPLSPR